MKQKTEKKTMFTQQSLEHEWFYSVKVVAHFGPKEQVDV